MIKIIKQGKKYVVDCSNCGAVLEYEGSDTKSMQTGHNEYQSYIECPCCRVKINVDKRVVV